MLNILKANTANSSYTQDTLTPCIRFAINNKKFQILVDYCFIIAKYSICIPYCLYVAYYLLSTVVGIFTIEIPYSCKRVAKEHSLKLEKNPSNRNTTIHNINNVYKF